MLPSAEVAWNTFTFSACVDTVKVDIRFSRPVKVATVEGLAGLRPSVLGEGGEEAIKGGSGWDVWTVALQNPSRKGVDGLLVQIQAHPDVASAEVAQIDVAVDLKPKAWDFVQIQAAHKALADRLAPHPHLWRGWKPGSFLGEVEDWDDRRVMSGLLATRSDSHALSGGS